jgi:hypothetical protein
MHLHLASRSRRNGPVVQPSRNGQAFAAGRA